MRALSYAKFALLAGVSLAILTTVSHAQDASRELSVSSQGLPTVTVQAPRQARRAARPPARRARTTRAATRAMPPSRRQPVVAAPPAPAAASGAGDVYAQPTASSSVTSADIAATGGDPREALRDVPGTFTRTNPQNPGVAVNIRGMEGAGRVSMTIDGVRQNFRFTGHEAGGFTYVDPALLSGIDIQRGAVSGAGGAGALAGAANFRTLGIDDIIKPGRNWGAIGNLNWGSNGVGFSEMVAGAARLSENAAIGGALSYRHSTDYKNGDGVVVPGTGQNLVSGLVKGDFILGEGQKLQLGGVFYNNDFFSNSYWQTVSNNTYTAKYSYTPLNNPFVDFRFNAAYNDLKMLYDPDPARNPGSARGRTIVDRGWGFDTSNTSRFMLGSVAVKTTYGFEFFRDEVNSVNNLATPDFGVNPSGTAQIGGAFSQTTFTYGAFDLIAGLRYDFFKVDGSGAVIAGNPVGLPAGPYTVNRDEGRFNPKVTLAYRAADWFQPFVTYAETFRPPNISELLTGGVHPGTGGMSFFPNPFLNPEISRGWEIGANFRGNDLLYRGDKFRLKANYFRYDVEDYITACMTPRGAVFFCNNTGNSLLQGVELQSEYDAGFFFTKLGYTYTHSDLPSQINGFGAASYVPDHVFSGTIATRFFDQRLTVGTRLSIISRSNRGAINIAPGEALYLPAYELVDLFATYKFDNGLEVGATVTNLLDQAYTGALTTPAAIGPVFNGRGRTVLLNARMHF